MFAEFEFVNPVSDDNISTVALPALILHYYTLRL